MTLLLSVGCAPSMPLLAGGFPTPASRGDVIVGGAVDVPLSHPTEEGLARVVSSGGVVPVAGLRLGLGDRTDFGVTVAGTGGRIDVRRVFQLSGREKLERYGILVGASALVIRTEDADVGALWSGGGEIPVLFTFDAASVIEAWVGVRLGVTHTAGAVKVAGRSEQGVVWGLGAGAVLGVAVGFRHAHALLELSAAYQSFSGAQGSEDLRLPMVTLTPAFALRLRL
jgi:hypothetical protein